MPGTTAYKAQPGGIVVDESIAGTIGTMRAMRGMADDSIPAVVQVSPAQPAAATALSGDWWNQPNLLPTSPQGTIASTGRDPSGNCRVTLNGAPVASIPADRMFVPDNTRLMYVDQNCAVKLVFNLPAEKNAPEQPVSIAGGGIRNPGNIIIPGKPGVNVLYQPPAGAEQTAARIAATLAALAARNPVAASAARTLIMGTATATTSFVILGAGSAYLLYKYIEDMNDKEAEAAMRRVETPSGPYEQHLNRLVGNFAKELSSKRDPDGRARGSCAPENIDVLKQYQEQYCQGAAMCTSGTDELDVVKLRERNKICLDLRIRIMDTCFAGGDEKHRREALDVLRNYRSCQGIKPYSSW